MVDPVQKCEKCGENLVPGARFCEACSHPVSEKALRGEMKSVLSRVEKRHLIWAVLSIFFLVGGLILGTQYHNNETKPTGLAACDNFTRVGDYFEALACYDKVIAESPSNGSISEIAYYKKGETMYNKLGEPYIRAKAADCFKESYKIGGNQSSLILQGLNLYWAKKFAESIDRLNEVKNKSCDCRIFEALSTSYNSTGNPEKAKENYYLFQECVSKANLTRSISDWRKNGK